MHRLLDAIHDHAPRLLDDAVTALVALGAFGLAGGIWHACVALFGGSS